MNATWSELASVPAVAAGLGTAGATFFLARFARRARLLDAGGGSEGLRKLQRAPVPAVGGIAIAIGLALGAALGMLLGARPFERAVVDAVPLALSLVFVLLVGVRDDRHGLGAGTKLGLQLLALVPVAVAASGTGGAMLELVAGGGEATRGDWVVALGLSMLAGAAALNVLNTFDNADGAAASVAALGLVSVAPVAALATLGFLPFNLNARDRGGPPAEATPTAYLGDAGAFVLALMVVAHPEAWGALVVPALDLARVVVARWRAGQSAWVGDRRHLAHRLQRKGLGARAVAAVLVAASLPAVVGGGVGVAVSAVLFVGLVAGTRG